MLGMAILALYQTAAAQHDPYEVLFNGTVSGETLRTGDDQPYNYEDLFLEPLAGDASLFHILGLNSYAPVRYSRGGLDRRFGSVTLLGIDLSGNLNTAADYNLWSGLRRSRLVQSGEADAAYYPGNSIVAGRTAYVFNEVSVPERISAGIFSTDHKGRMGIKASASGTVSEKWTYMADIYRKWGRDGTVKGVFTDKFAYSAGISAVFGRHRITLFSAGDASEDGLRPYITREVKELAGSNYYNPSWGMHDGKIRNSRVAKGSLPITVVNYRGLLSSRVSLEASAGYRGGWRSVSGLSWLDAATPYPDYYRYMPSYASSNLAEEIIRGKWIAGDPSITQIDWDGMYAVNAGNSQTAVYTLADRVERTRDLQGFLGTTVKIDERTALGFSLRGQKDDVRRFRRMKDLLGGMSPEDIDQYLYEDGIYGDKILNNAKAPYRKVNEGDIFGYDYDIYARCVEGSASVSYSVSGITIDGTVSYGRTSFRRNGRFEKELYPGNLSFGRSGRVAYMTYSSGLSARYAFDGTHSLTGHIFAGRSPQQWAVHFITPSYSNSRTGVDKGVTTVDTRAGYTYRVRTLTAYISLFNHTSKGIAETYGYWDDIYSAYSTMLLEDIGVINRGVEMAADYNFHRDWNVSAMFSAGSYRYSTDPRVTIYSENTLDSYVSGAVSYLRGYRTSASPEIYSNTRLRYSRRGYTGTLTANYAGGRYVSPAPLRRMRRAFNLALSGEGVEAFTAQEKLGDVFTIDLSFLKSFRIKETYLSIFLSVSNLLDNGDIVYSGYEQPRVGRKGSGTGATWSPFANKYLYGYGRSYYVSLTYTF